MQLPYAPCLMQTRELALRGVLHPGVVQNPFFPQKPPLFVALVLQLLTRHLPLVPCLTHVPLAIVLAAQPSTEHGGCNVALCSRRYYGSHSPSTLSSSPTVFGAQPPSMHLGGATIDQARFPTVCNAESQEDAGSAVGVVHHVHLAISVHMDRRGVVQRIVPPHAHLVTNREVPSCHLLIGRCAEDREELGESRSMFFFLSTASSQVLPSIICVWTSVLLTCYTLASEFSSRHDLNEHRWCISYTSGTFPDMFDNRMT